MGVRVEINYSPDGMAVLRIPDGSRPGDLVILQLNRVLVDSDVLEALVRDYHEWIGSRVECACGWQAEGSSMDHTAHVEHEVREALAGRAKL